MYVLVINTIVLIFSSTEAKGSSILYAFMNIILGSMLGMYVMFNGYRILAVAGFVDKTVFKCSGGLAMLFMLLFIILGRGNINGILRLGTSVYMTSTNQGWWFFCIMFECAGWTINLVMSILSYKYVLEHVYSASLNSV